MALEASDFIHPQGELVASLFDGGSSSLTASLDVWLTQAVGKYPSDEIKQQAYVYYSAYNYLVIMQATEYTSRTLGPASYTKSKSQLQEFPNRRNHWFEILNGNEDDNPSKHKNVHVKSVVVG